MQKKKRTEACAQSTQGAGRAAEINLSPEPREASRSAPIPWRFRPSKMLAFDFSYSSSGRKGRGEEAPFSNNSPADESHFNAFAHMDHRKVPLTPSLSPLGGERELCRRNLTFALVQPVLRATFAFVFLVMAIAVAAAPSWQEEFAKMPLIAKPSELNATNCVRILLSSFQRNDSVQALIIMPGATDELYFFRRVHARLTNDAPTLLDAITALTNQTHIQVTFQPPFLLLHTVEDPLEPVIVVNDERTAERIRKKHFEKHAMYNDRDWDYVSPIVAFDLDTRLLPGLRSPDSHHFFRHSFSEFDLTSWEALEAIALADKTKVTIERKRIVFSGDKRYRGLPPNLDDFRIDASRGAK